MSPSLKLLCLIALPSLVSCAVANDREAIHYKIDAEPTTRTARITCGLASANGCVFWIGDPKAESHRAIHLAAGATQHLGPEAFDASYCAGVKEERLAWPACLDGATAGALSHSNNVDYVFW